MSEIPEYVPPPVDIDLMRHEVINDEVYVNIEDLVKVLTVYLNALDRASTVVVNTYKQSGFREGASLYEQGTTVAKIVFALKTYADATKFDSIVNGDTNEQE